MLRTKDLQLRKKYSNLYKEILDYVIEPILKRTLSSCNFFWVSLSIELKAKLKVEIQKAFSCLVVIVKKAQQIQ